MAELNEITKGADKDPNSKPYYISTTALQIAERTMRQFIKRKKIVIRFFTETVNFILPNKIIIKE